MTTIKPATPLPWKVAPTTIGRFPAYPIAADIEGRRHQVAEVPIMARGGSDKDAAYIVHACNSLPRLEAERAELIAALRECVSELTKGPMADPVQNVIRANSRALLAKLGEG